MRAVGKVVHRAIRCGIATCRKSRESVIDGIKPRHSGEQVPNQAQSGEREVHIDDMDGDNLSPWCAFI
ncbi:hypothetical protein VIBNISO65_970018 [Vibrio nigripulchritudo SO65]|nr:hypothetical protein VIBNIAM115_1200103 [Vibrio nigripulchritudo AM115]CCN65392.1 hypothetical protein VIBNIPon4_390018 [Vibrio nigripulchritudo POn4]CCN79457.1 hypothetical protein VIBNISO65_970018 [Vibrio nigripulchritudo SO65]